MQLESPQLMLRGKDPGADFVPRPSMWEDHPESEFLALWNASRITEVYLDSNDPPDVLNFKKALISLFQVNPNIPVKGPALRYHIVKYITV